MAQLTRGEFARMLAEFMDLDTSATGGFTDTSGLYIDGHVTALKELGVTLGIGGGKFAPDRTLTRSEAITMLGRAFQIAPSNVAGFTDVPGGAFYSGFANAFKELGVFQGFGDGTFRGNELFEAHQFDLVLSRLTAAGFAPGGTNITPPTSSGPDVISPLEPEPTEPTTPVVNPDDPGVTVAMTDDYLQMAVNMLQNTFGIDVTSDVRAFIDRAWEEGWSGDEMATMMYAEQWFNDRFPMLAERRNRGHRPISPQEYIQLESGYAEQLRRAGFPPGFYDSPDDFNDFIANDRSVVEVRDDIAEQFRRVNDAPIEVREYFAAVYGADGDSALAAWFLDPNRSQQLLEEAADVAEIGGTASRFGFDLASERARRLADIGVDLTDAARGFNQLTAMSPLFEETVGEGQAGEDLDELDQGLDAVFSLGGQGARQIEQRRRQRVAAFQGGSGAAADQTGVFGLSTAS